jgi:outer membrane protein assembly complex protein YaeT
MAHSRNRIRRWRAWWFAAVLAVLAGAGGAAAKDAIAKLEISGLGWLGDREMRVTLERLLGDERGATLDANAIEDAMFLLMSAVQDEGFLKPIIRVDLANEDGTRTELVLDASMNVTVPRAAQARAVHFKIERGVRYFIDAVAFSGLSVLPEETARAFFVGQSALFATKANRAYTPSRVARGVDSLASELRQRGYAEAEVRNDGTRIDDRTGAVRLTIGVSEGVRWRVAAVTMDVAGRPETAPPAVLRFVGQPWSESLQQDVATEIRKGFLASGHPDARVSVTHEQTRAPAGGRDVALGVHVQPGEAVTMGEPRFEGAGDVRPAVIRRRLHATVGQPLNVLELEQARYRISRLGVFDRVNLRLEPDDGPVRSPVFALQPGRRMEVNLLAGYGSYEQLRAGVEFRQYNVLGLAHQMRGQLIESMKSTRGEYSYTVPELFGESVDGTAKLFGLQREEVAFERQEYGVTVALAAPLSFLGANATAGYTFQALRNRNNRLETQNVDDKQVTVVSVDGGLTRDRRDNPLMPRHGYRWFAQLEAASRALGGEAEYQRSEFGGSYHTAWGDGRWVHLSAAHGVITTWGTTDESLPVNKRFFPGGDGSIRGYRTGEASPRGADGKFVGAKSYVSGSVELEQALARKWSAVAFVDAMGTATQLRHYPFDETLFAAGLGLRYETLIGPIRLEYGRNLKRRPGDPGGTLLLSVGVPF